MQQFLASMAAILLTAAAGLAGAYIHDRFKNKRVDEAVRKQVAALLESTSLVLQVICESGDVDKALLVKRPLRLVLERLAESDVALAFKLYQLSALMHIITIGWPYLDAVESLIDNYDEEAANQLLSESPQVLDAIEAARYYIGDRPTHPGHDRSSETSATAETL